MHAAEREPGALKTAFDIALEQDELLRATEDYALRHGAVYSTEYRKAWLRFRQRIRTPEDLAALRLAQHRRARRASGRFIVTDDGSTTIQSQSASRRPH